MSRQWVVNASPLIVLAKAGQTSLLLRLSDILIVPHEVAEEIRAGADDDPARGWLERKGAACIQAPRPFNPTVLAWDLGHGETAVLSRAHDERGLEAIVDDRAARRCAAALGIPVRGTLSILLLAKRRGFLPAVSPVLDAVVVAGLHVDDNLLTHVRQLAGE